MVFAALAPLIAMAGGIGYDMYKSSQSQKPQKVPTMDKKQQAFYSQLMNMINPGGSIGQGNEESMDYLRQLMNPNSEAVNQFTQPYMNQFENETVPMLAERFAGMGGGMGGGTSSSGFGQSLSMAGSDLQTKLAALKAGLGQQAAGQLMNQYGNFAQMGMNAQPFAYYQPQNEMGAFPGMLNAWGQNGFKLPEFNFGGSSSSPQYGSITRKGY